MGQIDKPLPAKLIVGFIFKDELVLGKAQTALTKRFGKIDFKSPVIEFTYTDYYEKEFGINLKRQFISFVKLIPQENLASIKTFANAIELKLAQNRKRIINIDPGYLELPKLILATTKDFSHRIYLSNGIYAETTLSYKGNTFKPYEWTYPDYRTAEYIGIFSRIREIYKKQIE